MPLGSTELAKRLRNSLRTAAVRNDLPGLAISVRRDGREVFSEGFGLRDAQKVLPVTGDTLFGVASATKVLTAVLVMLARKDNLIRLSDSVSRFYPTLNCARDGRMHIRHLMSHSAGFPGFPFRHMASRPANGDGSRPILTPAALVEAINALDFDLLGAPGDCVSYSNEGFCLLGGIIETLYQCSFAQAADKLVFRPLQMDRSVIGAPAATACDDVAMPLRRSGSALQACGFWDAPLFDPAGGLALSVRDMSRLISILDGSSGVLGPDAARDMISMSLPVASRPGSESRYGLGLEVTQLDAGHSLAWHTGQRPGISSFAGHVPQKNVSVAVATNIADAPSASIGHQIIADVLSDELEPGSCTWPPQAGGIGSDRLERFCGEFDSQEIPLLSVGRKEGRLQLDQGSALHEFHFTGPSHGTVGGQTFCFLGDDGPVALGETVRALALDLRVLPRRNAA